MDRAETILKNYKYSQIEEVIPQKLYNCQQKGVKYSAVKDQVGLSFSRPLKDTKGFEKIHVIKHIKKVSRKNPPVDDIDEFFKSQHKLEKSFGGEVHIDDIYVTEDGTIVLINPKIYNFTDRSWEVELEIRNTYGTVDKFINADYNTWRKDLDMKTKHFEDINHNVEYYYKRLGNETTNLKEFANYLSNKLGVPLLKSEDSKYYSIRLNNGFCVDRTGIYFSLVECSRMAYVMTKSKNTFLYPDRSLELKSTNKSSEEPPKEIKREADKLLKELRELNNVPEIYNLPVTELNIKEYLNIDNHGKRIDIVYPQIQSMKDMLTLRLLDLNSILNLGASWSYGMIKDDPLEVVRRTKLIYSTSRVAYKAKPLMVYCLKYSPILFAKMLDECVSITNYKTSCGGECFDYVLNDVTFLYDILKSNLLQTREVFSNLNGLERYGILLSPVCVNDNGFMNVLVGSMIKTNKLKVIENRKEFRAKALELDSSLELVQGEGGLHYYYV